MDLLLFLGIALVMTIPFTAFICRRRLTRRRPISYGTVLAGAISGALFMLVCAFIHTAGWEMFTRQFWIDEFTIPHKDPPGTLFFVVGFVAAMCVLPALGVVIYYQVRSRDERRVA